MADTMKSTKNGVLVASRETLNTTATTRRKIPARVSFLQKEFSETRKKLEAETSIEDLLCRKRYSKMQRKQHLRGYRTEVQGKISGAKVRTKIVFELARRTLTQIKR